MIATDAQPWEPVEVRKALFTEEAAGRAQSMLASRRKAAGFPTGKTFFLEALRQQTVEAGMRVAWFRLGDLGVLIRSHRADDIVTRAVTRILRAELGVIDDIRLLPVASDATEGLYRVVYAAYDNGPSRSAQPLSRRLRRAHAQTPASRTVDRLLHHADSARPAAIPTAPLRPSTEKEQPN